MIRPWARTFDLISGEYGWTDDQIWDLPLARMRQIRDVIWTRRADDELHRVELEEAKVRAVVAAVHGAAGNKRGVAAAGKLQLVKRARRGLARINDIRKAGFSADPVLPMYSAEEIEAERQRLAQEKAAS